MPIQPILIFATLALALTVSAQCPPEVAARLESSGVPASQIAGVCPAAAALLGCTVAIEVHGRLVDDLMEAVLPFGVELPDKALTFDAAQYCGSRSAHEAGLIAIARSNGSPPDSGSFTRADCSRSLESIAEQLRPDDPEGWSVAARLKLTWTPWQLTLIATDAERSGSGPNAWDELRAALLDSGSAQVTPTSATELPVTPGSVPAIASNAVFYFDDGVVTIVIVPPVFAEVIPGDATLPPARLFLRPRAAVPEANASFVVSHVALNEFARSFLAQANIPVQTDDLPPNGPHTKILGEITLKSLQVEGGAGRYAVTGLLEDKFRFQYIADISLQADDSGDLAVSEVTFTSIDAACSEHRFPFLCEALNAGRQLLAEGASQAAPGVLRKKPWIGFLSSREVEIPWGSGVVGLRGAVQRITSDEEALVIQSDLQLTKP